MKMDMEQTHVNNRHIERWTLCSPVITNVYSFISTQQIFLPEQIYNKSSGAYKINTHTIPE